jgi:hypothetical protein
VQLCLAMQLVIRKKNDGSVLMLFANIDQSASLLNDFKIDMKIYN